MHPLCRILNGLTVIAAASGDGGWEYTLFALVLRRGRVRIKKRIRNFQPGDRNRGWRNRPAVLVIYGREVVSRICPDKSDFAVRIRENKEFISFGELQEGGTVKLTFMRREAYRLLRNRLEEEHFPIVAARICAGSDCTEEVYAAGKEYFTNDLTLRRLLKPSAEGSALASLLFSRLALPVLGSALVFLGANRWVCGRLEQDVQRRQAELGTLRQSALLRERRHTEGKQVETEYAPPLPYPYAFLADRIASAVPDGVMLTVLGIRPLCGRLQFGRPLPPADPKAIVRGESVSSASVAGFADTLKSLDFGRRLNLVSLDRDRESRYVFELEIPL